MKIAIATKDNWTSVSGHAGQVCDWLVFDCQPGQGMPEVERIRLTESQLPHFFKDDAPHPLHGVAIMVAASAGDGYVRHMAKWGARVFLTGESSPHRALEKILSETALPAPRFDITTSLCKLRDWFSKH